MLSSLEARYCREHRTRLELKGLQSSEGLSSLGGRVRMQMRGRVRDVNKPGLRCSDG